MERKDWTLLVIAAAKGKTLSPVQLQKSLFLIGEKVPARHLKLGKKEFYQFEPYDYGPFTSQIYSDAEELECVGLVHISQSAPYREYRATPAGLKKAQDLREGLDEKTKQYVGKLVAWIRSLSFVDLLKTVYAAYPDMAVKSVFKG